MTPDLRVLAIKYWPAKYRDEFEERAALLEFDGGVCSRAEAECQAREIVIREWEREQGAKHGA